MSQLQETTTTRGDRTEFGKILVGFDGSEHSKRAIRMACMLAKEFASQVFVTTVYSSPTYGAGGPDGSMVFTRSMKKNLHSEAERVVGQAISIARGEGIEATGEALKGSSPVQAIVEYALRSDVDLIVLGTRGLTGFRKLVVGSVSSGVAAHAHCPVLVAR